MSGRWVFVCGASGAGKDSVIGWAAQALAGAPAIVFARRLVTRAAHPASDHDEIGREAFARRREAGALAWHWEAHGVHYGIDARYAALVAGGRTVVVNGSREHAAPLRGRADVRIVLVCAPCDTVAARLRQRGRETEADVAGRLQRNAALAPLAADCVIDNAGELAAAGRQLAVYLEHLA
jgi:phosphonate metabolism protein PhnN/1,5-bisphosphokinase (PRPP-forming)